MTVQYPISQLDFQRDFTSFIELSQAIYGKRAVTDQELYQWLFAGNVFNPEGNHLFHVARDGDKVIASDGLLPVPVLIGGKRLLAAWSIKTMTHPDYQRRGIFREMTEYSLTRARELGIQLILGFANSESYPGYEKFGWTFLLERQAALRPLDIQSGLAKRGLFKHLAGLGNSLYQSWDRRRIATLAKEAGAIEAAILPAAPPVVEAIWSRMKTAFSLLVERNYNYINWRYNQRPRQDYKFVLASDAGNPLAMLVFRITNSNACIIVDYLGPRQSPALPALFYKTIQHCREQAVRYIIISSGIAFDSNLKQYGFKPLTAPLSNNMFIACPLEGSMDLSAMQTEANWFFSYGDSELDIDLQPLANTLN